MNKILAMVTNYTPYLLIGLCGMVIFLLFLLLIIMVQFGRLKKRYNRFTGGKKEPEHNLEEQMISYMDQVKEVDLKYGRVVDSINDLKEVVSGCAQKIGIVRYNPYEEMGGNLSFAVAILDEKNNGIVLNGIHSRTGTFTYAKPIESGVSTYVLCEEEMQAIEEAKKSQPKPISDPLPRERKIKIYRVSVPKKQNPKQEISVPISEKEEEIPLFGLQEKEIRSEPESKEQETEQIKETTKEEITVPIFQKEESPLEEDDDIISLKEIVMECIVEKK